MSVSKSPCHCRRLAIHQWFFIKIYWIQFLAVLSKVNEMSLSGLMISPRSLLPIYTILNMHTQIWAVDPCANTEEWKLVKMSEMWKSRASEILANSALWGLELQGRAGEGRKGITFIWHESRLVIINCYWERHQTNTYQAGWSYMGHRLRHDMSMDQEKYWWTYQIWWGLKYQISHMVGYHEIHLMIRSSTDP